MVMIGFFAEVAVGYTPYEEDHVHMPTVKSELERTKKKTLIKATLAWTRFIVYQ
jgi:hypothetical protein